ncbi:MAG TPA: DUF4245 domain-containing protein [Mycobacteriales bacterium]|nr:DUF4245 domain-containing protein [Mycobacteriales bacterium]
MSSEIARPKRMSGTALDMARSLGLMLVILAVTLIFVPGLLHPSKSQRVQATSYSDDAAGFKQVTGLAAATPTGLVRGWYANAARLTHQGSNATLYIGWVTPTGNYAGLYESNTGSIKVGQERPGDRSVRRQVGRLTIVITGSASEAELNQLADSLAS